MKLIYPATVAALFAAAGILAPPAAAFASLVPLRCSASVSSTRPHDDTTTDIRVRTTARAEVFTVAFYKTTNRAYYKVASASGGATVPYAVSSATPGFKVKVTVTVVSGSRAASCSTSFTPLR